MGMSEVEIAKRQSPEPRSSTTTTGPGLVTAHTGMRGLLALWIVIFHSLFYSVGWNLQGSALMPLFFLLSGYSLAIGYGKTKYRSRVEDDDKERRKYRSKFDFRSFYQNRFARIAPIYYVAMLIGLPLAIFGHSWVPPAEIGWIFIANLFAVQMWASLPPPSFAGPAWTVSTLVFFYLVFPWLLKWHQKQTDQSLNRWITILAVLQAAVFFALFFGILTIDFWWAFWAAHAWPISRVPVFEMGLVAGLLVLRQGSPDRDTAVRVMGVSNGQGDQWASKVDWGAGIFALFIVVLSMVQVVTKIELGGSLWMQGLFPLLMLQIIVGLSMAERDWPSVTRRLLNWAPLLFLGKISMSLYLVHEPIIQYISWVTRPDQTWYEALPTPMPAWGTAVVLPVSLMLAVLLERYVETPARNYLRSKPRRT